MSLTWRCPYNGINASVCLPGGSRRAAPTSSLPPPPPSPALSCPRGGPAYALCFCVCLPMRSLRTLPVPLLALLFALPVLSEPSTPNDPFHDVAAQTKKEPEPPICCLRPLAPLENTEEELLLSFEEWKAKQASGERATNGPSPAPPAVLSKINDNVSDTGSSSEQGGLPPTTAPLDKTEAPVPDAPHFHIPITDRFNYASLDCSARVHTAHKGAKSTSSILSSKKDRYLLSPCAASNQFVVVELCDDIRIDTVQLANYEFFSGVFKDFTVSVAKTHTMDPASWTFAGTYRAKNARGVQVSIRYQCALPGLRRRAVDLPPTQDAERLLPFHSYRLPLPLRKRILLPSLPLASLRPDTS